MHARFRRTASIVTVLVWTVAASQAAQTTFTENFEGGSNIGGWTFGNTAFETIEPVGGNPGAFLRNDFLDTFAAQPRTTLGVVSPFVGDYRAAGVRFVGIDLAVFSPGTTTAGRPLSVILFEDGGTPADSSDDCRAYRVGGHPTPMPNGNWARYRFRVPSSDATLPPGWQLQGCAGLTDDEAWNRVVTGVDQLRFFTGDPALFFIFQVWDIGADNPTVITGNVDPGP